jgi:hypothetical protein
MARRKNEEEVEALYVELPVSLMERFRQLAEENDRTLKGEVSRALEGHLERHGKGRGKSKKEGQR